MLWPVSSFANRQFLVFLHVKEKRQAVSCPFHNDTDAILECLLSTQKLTPQALPNIITGGGG